MLKIFVIILSPTGNFCLHFSCFLLFSSWFSWFFLLGLVLFAIFIFRVFCIFVCLPCQCGAIYVFHKRISAAVVIKMEHPPPHAVPSDPARHRHAGRRWATTPRQVPPPLAAALLARHPGAAGRYTGGGHGPHLGTRQAQTPPREALLKKWLAHALHTYIPVSYTHLTLPTKA